MGTPMGFAAVGRCGRTDPQNSPASNCWSGLRIDVSTTVSEPAGPLAQLPPAHGYHQAAHKGTVGRLRRSLERKVDHPAGWSVALLAARNSMIIQVFIL